jgi:two-component system phosphate regulon sensor histidine kinase PhoR
VVLEDLRGEQSRRIFQVSASPLGEASQGFNGVVVVFHDISRIKQLEELRREFVTNVSHELRTPLAIFHGYLETILGNEELSSEEMQRVLKVMKRHSDRLHELVVDLLTLSRLESGQIRLEPVALNVLGLLKRLQDDWSLLLKNKKCVMLINCSADLPVIEADALRIDLQFTGKRFKIFG